MPTRPTAIVVQHVMADGFGDAASAILACFAVQRLVPETAITLALWFDGAAKPAVIKRQQLVDAVAQKMSIRTMHNTGDETRTTFLDSIGLVWSTSNLRIVSCVPKSFNTEWPREDLAKRYPECKFVAYTEYTVYPLTVACTHAIHGQELCITTGFHTKNLLPPLPAQWDRETPTNTLGWVEWLRLDTKHVHKGHYRLWVYYCGCTTPRQIYYHEMFMREHVLPVIQDNDSLVAVVVMPKCSDVSNLKSFDRVQYITPSIPFGWMRSLMKYSGEWVGTTGDQSLMDAVSEGKRIIYEEADHKMGLFQHYLKNILDSAKIQLEEFDTAENMLSIYKDSTRVTTKHLADFSKKVLTQYNLFGTGKKLRTYVVHHLRHIKTSGQSLPPGKKRKSQ